MDKRKITALVPKAKTLYHGNARGNRIAHYLRPASAEGNIVVLKVAEAAYRHRRQAIKNTSPSQALHHAKDPAKALAEAHRILKPGGRVLILDLRKHEEAWVQEDLGDQWLGFGPDRLESLITDAGFDHVTVRSGARKAGDPFAVLIAAGTRQK